MKESSFNRDEIVYFYLTRYFLQLCKSINDFWGKFGSEKLNSLNSWETIKEMHERHLKVSTCISCELLRHSGMVLVSVKTLGCAVSSETSEGTISSMTTNINNNNKPGYKFSVFSPRESRN